MNRPEVIVRLIARYANNQWIGLDRKMEVPESVLQVGCRSYLNLADPESVELAIHSGVYVSTARLIWHETPSPGEPEFMVEVVALNDQLIFNSKLVGIVKASTYGWGRRSMKFMGYDDVKEMLHP